MRHCPVNQFQCSFTSCWNAVWCKTLKMLRYNPLLCRCIMLATHRSPVNSPHKGQWPGALMFSLIYAWMSGWVNNRKACDWSFQIEQKLIFTPYVIPPHWHTGSRNPSPSKTRTCLFYTANIMAADVLATQGARASATMILTMLNWIDTVPIC